MKYNEMNERQKKAFRNIKYATQNIIGELENVMMDSSTDSPEYQTAERDLKDHDGLVRYIYQSATTTIYDGCSTYFGPQAAEMIRDIRFCGKDWLMERIEKAVAKEGY